MSRTAVSVFQPDLSGEDGLGQEASESWVGEGQGGEDDPPGATGEDRRPEPGVRVMHHRAR